MALSSSSRPPDFLSFFTKLFTAFSDHGSSSSPTFQDKSRLTMGGVNPNKFREVIRQVLIMKVTSYHQHHSTAQD
jgi:hypothetical protein